MFDKGIGSFYAHNVEKCSFGQFVGCLVYGDGECGGDLLYGELSFAPAKLF